MKQYFATLILFLFVAAMASAQQTSGAPNVISYQGIVTSSDGSPLPDGEYPVTVTLYGDEGGRITIWQDTYVTPVRGGVFNIYLGSGSVPLPAPGQMDKSLWIGTRISEGEEMRPLTRLSSSPYAINVPDNAITTAKLANGAVTADKMNLDYISGLSVNGRKIAINGRVLNIQAGKDIDITFDDVTQSLVIGAPAGVKTDEVKEGRERRTLGTQQDAWTLRGDGVNVNTGVVVLPVPGDWIGTSNAVDFNLRTNNLQIMSYQQKIPGTTANVVGGDPGNSVSANAIGNVIAGGGGGGVNNTIIGDRYNVISGGISHKIDNSGSYYDVVGGGQDNAIGNATTLSTHAVIAGGQGNRITANHAAVGGGQSNTVSAAHGSVGGGQSNSVSAAHSRVGGGFTNRAFGSFGSVDGGGNNTIFNASSSYGAINGGQSNEIGTATAAATHGSIGGGFTNRIFGSFGSIDGGGSNTIFHVNSSYGSINGGQSNEIGTATLAVTHATIGGGRSNRVTATYGTVGGGNGNIVSSSYSTIAGGVGNNSSGPVNAIGGGQGNFINGDNGAIAGGAGNAISTSLGAIGGGQANQVVGNGFAATIPGGDQLTAQSYGQTVIGVLNIPKGNIAPGAAPNDEPIFIVGNGIQGGNSNAFEVSYNGHSTVFHNTFGATPVVYGGTYADNVIVAWGNVKAGAGRVCDFGVRDVRQLGQGWYQVELDLVDPDGNPLQINCGSVTATITNNDSPGSGNFRCAIINVSEIQGNIFDVYISDPFCNPIDEGFNFKVTGRP